MPFVPIGRGFVAEVIGIDLRTPLDADAAAAIHSAMDRYAVLVCHDQG
jgi:alpha-ketoglutarate-dependent 2,4-dichlorophenoxyacetate dioxygenase